MGNLRKLVEQAQEHDHEAVLHLLNIYKPLIDTASCSHGFYDEDLSQMIILRLLQDLNRIDLKNF